MMPALRTVIRSVALRVSPRYHARAVRQYWELADKTHADMSTASFEFYAKQIAVQLGPPPSAGRVLDHGAGEGQIGLELIATGYEVEFSEFAPRFVALIASKGQRCYRTNDVPADRFDTVFVNNAIFYVHPSAVVQEIQWLLGRLRSAGRLLLLDVPTLQRAHRLGGGWRRQFVRKSTGVYQPAAGGFFVDEAELTREFPNLRITDSWCDYRCHIEITR